MVLSPDQIEMLKLGKLGKLGKVAVDYGEDDHFELLELQLGGLVDQFLGLTTKGRQMLSEVWQG